MSEVFQYEFNVSGNAVDATGRITRGMSDMRDKIKDATGVWNTLEGKIVAFNNLTQYIEGFNRTVSESFAPGASLNASLADLSAISGEAGEGLKRIEEYARASAKTFGGSAANSVESYKLLLSQLSPELTKVPKALQAMGDNISILSKTMGGDTTAAAEVLTTAMNQYGISLSDPMEASRKMAEMMNIMAAAGKEGSSELPTIKVALEQCGMAAKAAGVQFAETNAAIQVLDKAGKKGAEGGVALRNVLSVLSQGRFLPKDVQEELTAAGVNINALTDKSKTLEERLALLKGVMNDTALFTKLFGRENSNAAMALVQGTDEIGRYKAAITGTNTAVEQAQIIMESYPEKLSRVRAKFDDLKISLFNATGDFGIWIEVLTSALVPVSQLMPLLIGVGKTLIWMKGINFAGIMNGISRTVTATRYQLLFLNTELRTGQMVSIGFVGNIIRATVATVRFSTVGLWSGIKALGAWIASLVTGGTASATFAGIASVSFATFKTAAVSACRAVTIAIKSIPVIGWIIAVIAAIGALFAYFWQTSVKFRAVTKGIGAAFLAMFKGVWDAGKQVFSALGDLIISALSLDKDGMKKAFNKMKGGISDYGTKVGQAFTDAYNKEIGKDKKKSLKDDDSPVIQPDTPDVEPAGRIGGLTPVAGSGNGEGKIRNITVNIDRLVEKFEINTTNLKEDTTRVKDMITEVLLGAVNDLNLAV